jgi:hypothetical protein
VLVELVAAVADPVDLDKRVAHSVVAAKAARPIANKSHGRLVAKRSTIYERQLLVAQ